MPPANNPILEGERLLVICNSCRYCEGYCAVFPAMERRMSFSESDVRFLANLCHNCAECYYACQYAPPHEFAVNVPQVFAQIREQSYEHFAWPGPLAKFFRGPRLIGIWIVALVVLGLSLTDFGGATFYAVLPHNRMVAIFLAISAFILTAHVAGFLRFWRDGGASLARFFDPRSLAGALRDVLTLKNLGSGGAGCTYPTEKHSQARRWFHQFTLFGFLLCFASTTVAAIYDNFLGRIAPYEFWSLPVVLGTLGGIGLLIGPAGLYLLKLRRDPAIGDPKQDGSDLSFIALLFLTSITGLLLLALRASSLMGVLLAVHLAVVLALFLTLPYGKFVHGIYRAGALVKDKLEPKPRR